MGNRHCISKPLQFAREVRFRLALAALVFLVPLVWILAQSSHDSRGGHTAADEYVGSLTCAGCHKDIYRTYLQTAMGRSMSQVSREWLKMRQASGSVEDTNNRVQFDVYARDGKLYQSEHQSGSDGQEVFRDTREVEWIIGAGENG